MTSCNLALELFGNCVVSDQTLRKQKIHLFTSMSFISFWGFNCKAYQKSKRDMQCSFVVKERDRERMCVRERVPNVII